MAIRLGSQLFVGRLSCYTTNQKLEKLFSPFGIVKEARLVLDPRTQKPKGFGFVTFDSESQAQKALKAMNGRIVDGRLLFVEVAKSINSGEDASA
ncbi:small RNA-binding protein 11, chloroplastic isoform X2 [Ricinus communis]|uniref:Cold-inducible RNA binding protein, putative n=1 Tax=Ricinus communis TaxID=3988 RepID=B9T4D6_RICCO|nr:small RNA-binding protein 11, chloroplastic isoform X2 [Ricinus communis]EEF29277.1 cold-inducible RNA binding protein, putative [Ricinus communis]|eukprot:XP_002533105.1 small RNA-binding protein 11, chloroplastic isoform X2 [Ricinus communis]